MSLFISNVDGDLVLTTAGYIASVVVFLILLCVGAFAAARVGKKRKTMSARQLSFCAISLALATATSMIKVFSFPFGGSITLFSMLFICLPGYFYGLSTGLLVALAYGVLQFILEPYIYFPMQVIVDYLLAFGALGLAGIFSNAKHGLTKGYIAGILGRYVFAVISGWIFFGEYAWEGWAALPYSLAYNGAYIFGEGLLTIIILQIPAVSKGFASVKKTAID